MYGIAGRVLAIMMATLCVVSCRADADGLADERARRIREAYPGMIEHCLQHVVSIGTLPTDRVDRCFEMTPMQRWRGVWADRFEEQQFCPASATMCPADQSAGIWLQLPESMRPEGRMPSDRLFEIEFIGRRTLKPGHHGHLGVFQHEMLIDRLVTLTPIDDLQ